MTALPFINLYSNPEKENTEMINSINIKNFRGIKNGILKNFGKINLIIGGNNTGKSALLESLYLSSTAKEKAILKDERNKKYRVMVPAPDYMGYNPVKRVRERHAYSEITKDLNEWLEGSFLAKINSSSPFSNFILNKEIGKFSREDASKLILTLISPLKHNLKLKINESVSAYMGQTRIPGEIIDLLLNPDFNKLSIPEILSPETILLLKSINEELYNSFKDLDLEIKKTKKTLKQKDLDELIGHFTFLWDKEMTYNYSGTAGWIIKGTLPEKVLCYDIHLVFQHLPLSAGKRMIKEIPGWSKDVYRSFARILNLPEEANLTFLPVENQPEYLQPYIEIPDNPGIPLDSYGDGARLVFKVLAPLVALVKDVDKNNSGLFLWEEPELFQNPATLYKLIETVATLIKDKNIQLFITSQSLEVIAYFTELIRNKTIEEKSIKAYQLTLSAGELKNAWFTGENLTVWLRNGFDPRIWEDFKSPYIT